MHEFDRDTAVRRVADGVWAAEVHERWQIGSASNGGYVAALGVAAAADALPHPDPFSITCHYLRPLEAGPVDLEVDVLRAGRDHSTAEVRIKQRGKDGARLLAVFGDLGAVEGATVVTARPPVLPAPDELPSSRDFADMLPEIAARFDMRIDPADIAWLQAKNDGTPKISGWTRFVDGREPDVYSLPLFVDSFPPAVLNVAPAGWVPTLELTVHIRARPAPGWLAATFQTRFLVAGYLEEDAELWDSAGRLVAQSRQLARIHPPRT